MFASVTWRLLIMVGSQSPWTTLQHSPARMEDHCLVLCDWTLRLRHSNWLRYIAERHFGSRVAVLDSRLTRAGEPESQCCTSLLPTSCIQCDLTTCVRTSSLGGVSVVAIHDVTGFYWGCLCWYLSDSYWMIYDCLGVDLFVFWCNGIVCIHVCIHRLKLKNCQRQVLLLLSYNDEKINYIWM